MARPPHGKSWYIHIDDPLSPGREVVFKEKAMLSAHDRRLNYAYIMTYYFEHVIAKEFRNSRASFENFGLGLFASTNYDDSCIISEHHIELIS